MSFLIVDGKDPKRVMTEAGHTDPKMTLGLYAKALKSKRRPPHARCNDRPLSTSAQTQDLDALNADEVVSDRPRIAAGNSEEWS